MTTAEQTRPRPPLQAEPAAGWIEAQSREPGAGESRPAYRSLFRRFVGLTLICSLVPLILIIWLGYVFYADSAGAKAKAAFSARVDNHRQIIELFLKERLARLRLLAETQKLDQLVDPARFKSLLDRLNKDGRSFTDLGVIDDLGRHLVYIGPYDLMDKNYSEAHWFKQVMSQGLYISDMFMGFRQEPHFIIAVTGLENGRKWILRATIDTEVFRSLVENVHIGQTGQVYLLNREGVFQTSPRFSGRIMGKALDQVGEVFPGIQVRVDPAREGDRAERRPRQLVGLAWLKEPKWMLVIRQDTAEAFREVNDALTAVLIALAVSALTILAATVLITRHMIRLVEKRDEEKRKLDEQLLQAGKLAAIGELSAGVAHEINNPLAIILTERQILADMLGLEGMDGERIKEQLSESLDQIHLQVQRCKRITQNLLRFARRTTSVVERVELNSFLKELVELMEREARTGGVKFITRLDPDLPAIVSDLSQLQQIFLNLITNAIDAHDGRPYGAVTITTLDDPVQEGVIICVADTGSGIAEEHLAKIFDPFFTTKPVGKGTGLGLSICYSLIRKLGGWVRVSSVVDAGTEFTIFMPYQPAGESYLRGEAAGRGGGS